MQEFLKQNEEILQAVQKRAGIDSEKVQKTVSSYLQIARDNQLNQCHLVKYKNGRRLIEKNIE